jgi:hypothetical protein
MTRAARRTARAARAARTQRRPLPRTRCAADATSEPDPGPAPEAVFDRVTGPYLRRSASALPGARLLDGEA